jgi:hypothetical protein
VAHFHYVMSLGAVFGIFAGIYFWMGKMSGREYPEWAGKLHFWMMFIGSNLTFFPQHFLGNQGMPRRYIDYPEAFAYWNYISSIGAFIAFASFVFFIGVVFYTLFYGRRITENNYWNEYADTLEWTLPSPPPEHTFEQLPRREDWDKSHALHRPCGAVVPDPARACGRRTGLVGAAPVDPRRRDPRGTGADARPLAADAHRPARPAAGMAGEHPLGAGDPAPFGRARPALRHAVRRRTRGRDRRLPVRGRARGAGTGTARAAGSPALRPDRQP